MFTINGTNYFADEGMTWADWFASDYNTTGKTAADVQSISANGAAIELSAVIVGGTAYEVGFAQPVTITVTNASWAVGNDADARKVEHNGVTYSEPTTFTANIGDIIVCTVGAKQGGYASIGVNGTSVVGQSVSGSTWEYFTYEYVVVSDAQMVFSFTTNRGQYSGSITITET